MKLMRRNCTAVVTGCWFLRGVSIACYGEPCISYDRDVRPCVCLSVNQELCYVNQELLAWLKQPELLRSPRKRSAEI